jgi:MoaA/NifB/PqqE/SkfB family radical SAM enzyme
MSRIDAHTEHFRGVLNKSLKIFFKDTVRVTLGNPSQTYFFYKTVQRQQKAARLRKKWERCGIVVPPVLIFSITTKCNLTCENCYAQALHPPSDNELSKEEIRSIFSEAKELGVSLFVIAGGEPFLRPELLELTAEFSDLLFLVFTNGMLIDDTMLKQLKRQKNVVPMVSLEGQITETDERRGEGVYEFVENVIKKLHRNGIFFGTSLTITRSTFSTLTNYHFVQRLARAGCKFFLYLEYTPIIDGTGSMVLTREQRSQLMELTYQFHSKLSALFITVPGHEEEVGGCLAAGRGFVHLTAEGDIEPCPFAPFSDTNVRDSTLKEALQSALLRKLRKHPEQLQITQGGCCLWKRRKWVSSLIKSDKQEVRV